MRPSPRRLAASALAALGLLSVAALPALAHDKASVHSVSWVDSDPNDSPNDGDKLYGIDFVAAKASVRRRDRPLADRDAPRGGR